MFDGVLVYVSVVLEATHEASQSPLEGIVLATKAFQGSGMETRELLEGLKDKSS